MSKYIINIDRDDDEVTVNDLFYLIQETLEEDWPGIVVTVNEVTP